MNPLIEKLRDSTRTSKWKFNENEFKPATNERPAKSHGKIKAAA